MTTYDIVIIGGGIAGIYTMYSLSIKFPQLKILLETNKRFGGRVYTYNKHYNGKDYVMDLGAGRIGHHHRLMAVKLIKQLNLQDNIINIDNTECYIEHDKSNKTTHDLIMLLVFI